MKEYAINNPSLSASYDDFKDSLLETRIKSAREKAGLVSRLFMWWVYPILKLAQRETLEIDVLDELPNKEKSDYLYTIFKKVLNQLPLTNYTLIKALFITFKWKIVILFFWLILNICSQIVAPILIKLIIEYIDSDQEDIQYATLLIAIMLFSRFTNMIGQSQVKYLVRFLGFEAQQVLSIELLSKSFKISFQSNVKHKSGEVINLMQVDAGKLQFVTLYLGVALLCPIQLMITIYLMFVYIGVSFLSGFGVMVLASIINTLNAKILLKYQTKMMKEKDSRTKCANQIFSQIKFIKINAFEEYFKRKLFKLREVEVQALRQRYFCTAYIIFSVWITPLLILTATFTTYILLDHNLTAANTFAIIGLFQMLQYPLLQLPMAINELITTNVSLKRIQKFLFTDEMMLDCIEQDFYQEDYAIVIQEGNFYWPKQITESSQTQQQATQIEPIEAVNQHILLNINLKVPVGQFVAIIGDVGSGKSSLLQAIIGEMLYEQSGRKPSIRLFGSTAYVGQKTWIQNSTVKENIVFGYKYDERKYQNSIKYSCLVDDLKILIKGDQTMIGEKGINLSGGQKARISLARAIYSDADIFLLDDPISAVDAHVGNFIMNKCLNGYLSSKTRVLVTHALNNCQFVDYIYLMEDGQIKEEGKFDEIRQSVNFKKIYEKFYKDQDNEEVDVETQLESKPELIKNQISEQIDYVQTKQHDEADELMIEEDRQRGYINLEIYKEYFKSNGGIKFYFILLIAQVLWIQSYVGNSLTIAFWTEQSQDNEELDNFKYLRIYFYFALGQGIFAVFRPFLLVIQSLKSSNIIHTKMINCLLYAQQCTFFERVPLGRLLNRFTKDLNSLDTEIYWAVSWFLIVISLFICQAFLYIYSSTLYVLIPLVLYVVLCWFIKELFMKASRELQRLESITKSPILSYFAECVNGLTFIRVFKKENYILDKHQTNMDINKKIYVILQGTTAWFMLMLGVCSLLLNGLTLFYCVFYSTADSSFTGLLLTYASNLDEIISEIVQSFSAFELGMVSFERCYSFTKVEPEKAYKELVDKVQNQEPHQEQYLEKWPQKGEIQYKNYSVAYREGLKPALSNLTFTIEQQDKVGIVGRTGAGKSSITLSLLRILEAMEGEILIDNVNIATLSLKQLRENITMIMQDATIFDGTIRENIDPLNLRSDDEINETVQKCCLKELVDSRKGLDGAISEGGDNLSAGEKQLLCIARAVLKKSKIVLIDEATANIDVDTEHKIQDTILNVFKECTVVTIAHRINTILHCDKILVIDQGKLLEYGRTNELLQQKSSTFYGIYEEALKHQKK